MSELFKSVDIKTSYNDEERSFKASLYNDLESAFCALQAFVTDSYSLQDKLSKDDQILIQFKDDEGDLVTLTSIEDFKDALDLANEDNTPLVLYVTIRSFKHTHQHDETNSNVENDEKQNNSTSSNEDSEEGVEFGKNLFEDLCNHEEFKNEFILFLKTLLSLLKQTAFDPSFDIETIVMQAVSSHEVLMDYPLFRDHLFNFLKKPNLSNKIKPFISMFLFNLEPTQIENWVNQAVEHYRASHDTNSNSSNNSNMNGQDFLGSLFGQGGQGGQGGNQSGGQHGHMPFFMQYLSSLISGGPGGANNNDTNDKPTKGGSNENEDEPVVSSTIGTKYEPTPNDNTNKQNGSNESINSNNSSNEASQNSNWNPQQPSPGADFFAQLMNSAFGGNNFGAPPSSAPNSHNNNNNNNNHSFGGFGPFGGPMGQGFGRGHPWRGRGGRGRGMGPRGNQGPFRPPGGAFGGPFAQLLTSLAGAGGVQGSQQNTGLFGQQYQNQQNEQLSSQQNNDNNSNINDNDNDMNEDVEGVIIKDDSTLGDGACVFANQILFKTWRIRNVSDNSWNKGLIIKYIGEPFNAMINGASFTINNDKIIEPNEEIECQVCIVAPNKNGEYKSEWCIEMPGAKKIKLDKKLIVRINVLEDNMELRAQDVEMRTSVKELNGETSMNASVISVINGNDNGNNNNNNGEDLEMDDINQLADLVSGMERVESKEVIGNNGNDNVNQEDIEMKDEMEDLAASMVNDTVVTGDDGNNNNNNNNDKDGDKDDIDVQDKQDKQDVENGQMNEKDDKFVFAPQLKSLQDMGFGEQNEDLLKSLLTANEGNLDKVVGILSYA